MSFGRWWMRLRDKNEFQDDLKGCFRVSGHFEQTRGTRDAMASKTKHVKSCVTAFIHYENNVNPL